MPENRLYTRIIQKHDTEAQWNLNPDLVPLKGELIIYDADETTLVPRFKVGDGITRIVELPFSASPAYSIPSFWAGQIVSITENIQALQTEGGDECFTFGYMSDMHIDDIDNNYCRNIGNIAAAVAEKTNIDFILNAGDMMSNDSLGQPEQIKPCYDRAWKILAPISDKVLALQGNHDGTYGAYTESTLQDSYSRNLPPETIWQYLFRPQNQKTIRSYGPDGSYYYVDNLSQKIRFICLNSQDGEYSINEDGTAVWNLKNGGYTQAQLDWLIDSLRVENGWSIIISSHIPPTAKLPIDYSSIRCYDIIRGITTAYCNRNTYQGSYIFNANNGEGLWANVNISVDFSEERGEIIGWFSGHAHRDAIIADDLPFPIITITSASNFGYDESEAERTLDTITETAIDFVTINKKTKVISFSRLGVGSDRSCSYNPGGVNLLKSAIGNDGNIFNGIGWKEGYRISASSGAESANAATDLTGYIPAEIGDMVLLYNIKMPEKTSNVGVHFYSAPALASKLHSQVGWDGASGFPGNNWTYTVDGLNVTSFIIPNWDVNSGTQYIRLAASEITEKSAIVVVKKKVLNKKWATIDYIDSKVPNESGSYKVLTTDKDGVPQWINRVTDENGNGWFSGNVYAGGSLLNNSEAKKLATEEYVLTLVGDTAVSTQIANAVANKADASHKHIVAEISDLTATATELNYMDGVTSNVQTQLNGKANSSHAHNYATTATYSGTLTSGGWSSSAPYSQTVTISGILATDTPFADVNMSSASTGDAGNNLIEAWSFVGRITVTADNTVVAYCYDEKPTINIPFVLKVVR